MPFNIYLSAPNMFGKELHYIQQAFDTNWIAPNGPNIDAFEAEIAEYLGADAALAVDSGTAAIHLAARWLGVGAGDTVFCSDFTFAGSCNPIFYQNATPVFIDSEPDSWNMSPIALEKAFKQAKATGKMPKAVIIVDLYGEPADYDSLLPICEKYGVPVIEDSAESLGSFYNNTPCGAFGDVAVLSFNGNKIITTSGGGMVLGDKEAIAKMRFWSTQAREPVAWYEHKEYGYNYRLSNISAGIGRGQFEFLPEKLKIRRHIREVYTEACKNLPAHIKQASKKSSPNCWLNVLYIDTDKVSPSKIINTLAEAGIESRAAWKPMHMQPFYGKYPTFSHFDGLFLDEDIFNRSVCLPSGDGMTEEQLQLVTEKLKSCF